MVVCAVFSLASLAQCIPALVAACLSCYAIFLYKKRPLQAGICRLLLVFGVAFIAYLAMDSAGDYSQEYFIVPTAATAAAAVCWLLASIAIVKDEKLVRSLDRIR